MKEPINDSLEDVGKSIKDLKDAQKKRRPLPLSILMWVFFPVTLLVLLFKYLYKNVKLRITTKTTIIFTVLYGLLLFGYIIFVIVSVEKQLKSGGDADGFITSLKITSFILLGVFLVLGAVVGNLASLAMLGPIRRMINKIKKIDGESLDTRLDPVDAQDELMELTDQINKMLASLEEAFDRQNNFISDASHELKTPLAVIGGYADMLSRWGKDDHEVLVEGIEAINREARYMKKIVEQLLMLAKLGRFNMAKTEFDLGEAVEEVVSGYEVLDLRHEIEVQTEKIMVTGDRNLIIEAVRTLLDNAIKYTPGEGGKITVAAVKLPEAALIRVSDNGPGIGEEDVAHIFDRFYRCDRTRGREKGSAGLGLTVCKSIIETMGGKIEVASKLGCGTTFRIYL